MTAECLEKEDSDALPCFDVVVVGAGFAGLYAIYEFRKAGLSVQAFECGSDVGGTWYWNRYPGARCDVRAQDYSYSFSEELQDQWRWPSLYAEQADVLGYVRHVANRFDLRRSIRFSTRVVSAQYDERASRWIILTDSGARVACRFCVMATGFLSVTQKPAFAGLENFQGSTYHTGEWPHHDVQFAGRRVGVIGTGSSGIQIIPLIARQAEHLYVFQRTPHFTLPARNRPLGADEAEVIRRGYSEYRRKAWQSFAGSVRSYEEVDTLKLTDNEREALFETFWAAGGTRLLRANKNVMTDMRVNELVAEFVRRKIAKAVRDPTVAQLLTPRSYPIGTKRICLDTGYYETFNRANVQLVDVKSDPIEALTPHGIRTTSGVEFPLDIVVFATGYDAFTGALTRIDVRGRGGLSMKDKWRDGPRATLGIMSAGFPNLFIVNGPGTPAALANPILQAELQGRWIRDCIGFMKERGLAEIETTATAEERWTHVVNEAAARTLYPLAQSWYMGVNVPGKAKAFLLYIGGFDSYRKQLEAACADGYASFGGFDTFGDIG